MRDHHRPELELQQLYSAYLDMRKRLDAVNRHLERFYRKILRTWQKGVQQPERTCRPLGKRRR